MNFKYLVLVIFFLVNPINLLASETSNARQAIVFDWDDTLLPTTHLKIITKRVFSKESLIEARNSDDKNWIEYDKFIFDFLSKLNKKSDIFIISNGTFRWLMLSSSIMMPQTHKLFLDLNKSNRIISANDFYYENMLRADASFIRSKTKKNKQYWKPLAFSSYLNNYKTIISIGDDDYERIALFNIDPNNKIGIIKKSVKIIRCIHFYDLIEQLSHIEENWQSIIEDGKSDNMDKFMTIDETDEAEAIYEIDDNENLDTTNTIKNGEGSVEKNYRISQICSGFPVALANFFCLGAILRTSLIDAYDQTDFDE